MARRILLMVAGAIALGSIVAAQAAVHRAPFVLALPGGQDIADLVLYAFGTHPVPPGKIRVPIQTPDATYEAIVTKPGLPALTHLTGRVERPK